MKKSYVITTSKENKRDVKKNIKALRVASKIIPKMIKGEKNV